MSDYQAPASDSEDEYEDVHSFGGRDGFIYVIDANEEMFDENESELSKFRTSLDCIESMAMSQIVNSEKNLLGVIVYNTKNNPPPKVESDLESDLTAPNAMAIYLPMRVVSKETISKMKGIRESEDLHDFSTVYGHSDSPCKFSDVIWLCSKMFSRCGYKLQSSTIILFTNRDEPHPRGSNEYQQAFIKANDLAQQNIVFSVVPMSTDFCVDNFYQEFVCTVLDEDPSTFLIESGASQIEFMKSRSYNKDYRKKCNGHLKLYIGDVTVGVGLYNCTRSIKFPVAQRVMRETNEVIKAKRNYVVGELNPELNEYDYHMDKKLLPSEIRKSVNYGNEEIKFTSEEVTDMKCLMAPGIKLLGFKPISKFSIHNHIAPANFIFYDETTVKGSAVLFRTLWEKCLEKEKAAICVLTSRRKVPPKYVALIPQTNKIDKNNATLRSNGFRLIHLPCESNIRNLDVCDKQPPVTENDDTIEIFEKFIKKLKFTYRPNIFDNPKLKKIYSYIESIAFDIEHNPDEDFFDSTKPNIEEQDSKIDQFITEISELFGDFDLEHGTKTKRPATTEIGGPAPKTSKISNKISTDDIKNAIRNGTIEKYTVAELKAYLSSTGEPGVSKMTKPVLTKRIKAITNI